LLKPPTFPQLKTYTGYLSHRNKMPAFERGKGEGKEGEAEGHNSFNLNY
jgi:hypothetical protein